MKSDIFDYRLELSLITGMKTISWSKSFVKFHLKKAKPQAILNEKQKSVAGSKITSNLINSAKSAENSRARLHCGMCGGKRWGFKFMKQS